MIRYGKIEKIRDEGEAMKIFFVTILLAISLLSLILLMDLIMGTKFNQMFSNLLKPFAVEEPAEYFIIFGLLAFLIIKPIIVFLVKKITKTSSSK